MSLRPPRRLCLALIVLALGASPPALWAAPSPSEPPRHEALSTRSVPFLEALRLWFGFGPAIRTGKAAGSGLSADSRCTIDPNGGPQCSPAGGPQAPAPQ